MREKEREKKGGKGEREGNMWFPAVCTSACVRENMQPVKSVYCWGWSEMRNSLRSLCYTDMLRYSDFFVEPFFIHRVFLLADCFPTICARNVHCSYFPNLFIKNAFLHRYIIV